MLCGPNPRELTPASKNIRHRAIHGLKPGKIQRIFGRTDQFRFKICLGHNEAKLVYNRRLTDY
jgi:hypothetical protein